MLVRQWVSVINLRLASLNNYINNSEHIVNWIYPTIFLSVIICWQCIFARSSPVEVKIVILGLWLLPYDFWSTITWSESICKINQIYLIKFTKLKFKGLFINNSIFKQWWGKLRWILITLERSYKCCNTIFIINYVACTRALILLTFNVMIILRNLHAIMQISIIVCTWLYYFYYLPILFTYNFFHISLAWYEELMNVSHLKMKILPMTKSTI